LWRPFDGIEIATNKPSSLKPKRYKNADYVGAFAVTTGIGADKKDAQFLAAHDDYSSILFKALADRLAEAFAELMHQKVRTDFWGYAPDEALSVDDLIAEKYRGIRPTPGYPACPDHSVRSATCLTCGLRRHRHGPDRQLAMTPGPASGASLSPMPRISAWASGDDQVASLSAQRCGQAGCAAVGPHPDPARRVP
jgi:5-methyltetrahydrofolate--homocysteine methyltransferase